MRWKALPLTRLDLSNPGAISPRQADILRVAAAVYFADRLVRRRAGWKRRIELTVELCQPEVWSNDEIRTTLDEIVSETLGGESWAFDFEKTKRVA